MKDSHIGGVRAPAIVVLIFLLVVGVPAMAVAYPLRDGPATGRSQEQACSVDPRILKMEPLLCARNDVGSDPVETAVSQAPTSSTPAGTAFNGWWAVGIASMVGALAAIAVAVRERRPQALS
jgi:hypothetical protein